MARPHNTPLLLALAAFAASGVCAPSLRAQTHKVETPATVVRAVGVYEWTGDLNKPTASRLVPVSLYINGRFQDAGVYLSRPVPFALNEGFSYELDEAGVARGNFDTLGAFQLNGGAMAYDDPWAGNGRFVPLPAPPKEAELRTIPNPTIVSSKPLSSGGSSGGPKLVNKSEPKPATNPPARPTPDPSTVGTGAPAPRTASRSDSSSSGEENDVDRPTLRRRPPPTKEDRKKAEEAAKKASQSSVSGPDKPLNDDPDRPVLRHHSDEDTPAGPAQLNGLPPDMHQLTAVSDAVSRPEHNFARPWQDDNEHAAVLAKMQAMAREQLAAYEKVNPLPTGADTTTVERAGQVSTATPSTIVEPDTGKPTIRRGAPKEDQPAASKPAPAPTPAKPTTAAARRRAAAAAAKAKTAPAPAPAPQPLLDEQLRGYELSYGADPTYIYTAHTPGSGAGERFVTLVAQQDPFSHDLKLALHSVTDATHLDRTPQMRPLDAVDADATNRASLLVEMRFQNARQFALYRVIGGRADQIFLSGTTR